MFGFINKLFPKKQDLSAESRAYDLLRRARSDDGFSGAMRENSSLIDTRETRQRLRDLSRYEYRNNPHLRGLCQKIDNETIGKGPRLTIDPRTPSDRSRRAADRVEKMWNEWVCSTGFVEKLRLMCSERRIGGESFSVVAANRTLNVPIDFTVYEGDQFQSPAEWYWKNRRGDGNNQGCYDGIIFDRYGNPSRYMMLKDHPYGNYGAWELQNFESFNPVRYIDSTSCFHWFYKERPSQYRGVSEIAPTLEVYSKLRRFIEAKVEQEELRARLLGSVRTAYPPDNGCADLGDEPIDMQIAGGQFTTLPDGWQIDMFRFDPTGQGVQEFMRACLSWATQALLAPWNVVANDSSDYNFASGRLDHMTFYSHISIIRDQLEKNFLNWFFENWWLDVARQTRRWPDDVGLFNTTWYWDEREPIDPNKAASAAKTLKENGLLDEVRYWEDKGENALDVAKRQYRYELEKQKIKREMEIQSGMTINEDQEQL